MKSTAHMTDGELQYAASDLRLAIAVSSPDRYSNLDRYVADYRAVIDEQDRRARKRLARRNMADMPCDLLACAAGLYVHHARFLHTAKAINTGQEYRRKQGISAMYYLYL